MFKKIVAIFLCITLLAACSQPTEIKKPSTYEPQTRTYYIAAENVDWDYAPMKMDMMTKGELPSPWGDQTVYEKVCYIEYTDETFQTKKPQAEHLGILGPIIRGVEGDTIKVVFLNKGDQPYSIHPHGLQYDAANEGITPIEPGETFTYQWQVDEESAPSAAEGSSKLWMYHSHVDAVEDMYAGLIGPIIITKAQYANPDGTPNDIDKEFVNMFFVFDESEEDMEEDVAEGHLKHAVNGFIFGNIPGLQMTEGDKVRWHVFSMGTEVDLHTPHWHGGTVLDAGIRRDVVSLLPAEMLSVDMVAKNVGEWMYHCHVSDHITAGMTAMYTITAK